MAIRVIKDRKREGDHPNDLRGLGGERILTHSNHEAILLVTGTNGEISEQLVELLRAAGASWTQADGGVVRVTSNHPNFKIQALRLFFLMYEVIKSHPLLSGCLSIRNHLHQELTNHIRQTEGVSLREQNAIQDVPPSHMGLTSQVGLILAQAELFFEPKTKESLVILSLEQISACVQKANGSAETFESKKERIKRHG